MSKHVYFASDFHLGVSALDSSIEREQKIVQWLDDISDQAAEIYFLGDVFDYWFEYRKVIPKGFTYLFSKIRELRDAGISMYYFTGNHDMWMFKYMTDEYGIPIYREPITKTIMGKKVYLAHGDGLGPGDLGYKFIKRIFNNRACQFFYSMVHPDIGLWIMKRFSHQSRLMTSEEEKSFHLRNERTIQFAEAHVTDHDIDYYVMGHRHLPIQYQLHQGKAQYINLGDWLYHYSYGVMREGILNIEFYQPNNAILYGI